MRINVIALSITTGLLWGGAILIVALLNMMWPPYGRILLEFAASIYPGYHIGPNIGQAVIGSLYGLVDGAVGGLVFGWLYNFLSRRLPGGA